MEENVDHGSAWQAPSRARLGPILPPPDDSISEPADDLVFEKAFVGRQKLVVDLRSFPRRAMALEALRVIRKNCDGGTAYNSPGAIGPAITALRRLALYLAKVDPVGTVAGLGDVDGTTLVGFSQWLIAEYPHLPGLPKVHFSKLLLLLERAVISGVVRKAVTTEGALIARALPNGTTKPREPYPRYVVENLAKVCRSAVVRILSRMNEGRRWARAGGDPEILGWRNPKNVTWHLQHRGMIPAERYRELVESWRLNTTWPETLNRTYMEAIDFVPFIILIALDTGLPIECIRQLDALCLQDPSVPKTDLMYVKRRRAKGEKRWREPVDVKRRFSAGWLIAALQKVTAIARRHAGFGEREGPLLLGRDGPLFRRFFVGNGCVTIFLRENPVATDAQGGRLERMELCRLRKTVVYRRYQAADGDIRAAASGHSFGVFAHHYAILQAAAERHEKAVAKGLSNALAAAMPRRPSAPEAQRVAAMSTGKLGFGAVPEHAWISGCLDRFDSPYATKGAPCGAPLWGCLDCSNAIFPESKIPGLLRLLDEITTKRQHIPRDTWREVYGISYARIMQILDGYDQEKVAAAMTEVEIGADWLPTLTFVGAD